jgi:hypothetical protein
VQYALATAADVGSEEKGKGGKGAAKARSGAAGRASLPTLVRLQAIDLDAISPAGAADAQPSGADGGGAIEIDWGGSGDDGGGGEGGGSSGGAVEIDWGGAIEADGGGGAAEIDWGGAIEGGGGGMEFEIEVEEGVEGVSAEELAFTSIFEDAPTRNALVDDLLELQGFFRQHAKELGVPGASSALPVELQLDVADVQTRLDAVDAILAELDHPHTRHLLLLGTSGAYLARQVASLTQMLDTSDKMAGRAEELQTRMAELSLTISSMAPKYKAVVTDVGRTKDAFEAALSKVLEGRRVNLMGEINTL